MEVTTTARAPNSSESFLTCSRKKSHASHFTSFGRKQCCLPRGGQPSPPSPPSGTQCPPSGWSWHSGKGCCVPHNPPDNQPPPQCNNGWDWDDNDLKCCPHSNPTPPSNPPKPSGKSYHKRTVKARTVSLCPRGLEACPIPGLSGASGDVECLDTDVEITSCGGCASTGAGQDCTALEGVWNVGCYRGSCQGTLSFLLCH